MKTGALIAAILMVLAPRAAWAQSFARSAQVHRPFEQVCGALENYFSPDSMHDFRIVSRKRTSTRAEWVAARSLTDQMKWTQWAFCKVPAAQMLDTLQQGDITIRVKAERESADRTYISVTPQFQAQYRFAGNTSTRRCASNGVLEKDILRAAGARDSD